MRTMNAMIRIVIVRGFILDMNRMVCVLTIWPVFMNENAAVRYARQYATMKNIRRNFLAVSLRNRRCLVKMIAFRDRIVKLKKVM